MLDRATLRRRFVRVVRRRIEEIGTREAELDAVLEGGPAWLERFERADTTAGEVGWIEIWDMLISLGLDPRVVLEELSQEAHLMPSDRLIDDSQHR